MIDTEAGLVERKCSWKGPSVEADHKIDPSQECDKEPRRHKTLLGCIVITSREGREIQPARGPGRLHPCSGSMFL